MYSSIGSSTVYVYFGAYRITESVPRYTNQSVDLPMEEYIRPGWYGDCWHPSLIGQVYNQFFGTGSITDQQQVDGPGGTSIGASYAQAQQALAAAKKAVDADDPSQWAAALLSLDNGNSVADAVAFIAQTYSAAKQMGSNIDAFISNYTYRPIATMIDMFGTDNLTLDSQGINVIQGIEGIHSRAFGPYNQLFGLVAPQIANVVGIQRGSAVAQRADTRAQKQLRVTEYVAAIQASRAILG